MSWTSRTLSRFPLPYLLRRFGIATIIIRMGAFTGKDSDCAGYAAIAVAVGMDIHDAWLLARKLDRDFHPNGESLAVAVYTEAKRMVEAGESPFGEVKLPPDVTG